MSISYWHVPELWRNETVVMIGGGPSAKSVDIASIQGRARVITINNSWELAPFTDVLFFGDARWWRWHGGKVPLDFSGRIVTVTKSQPENPRFVRLRQDTVPSGHSLGDDPLSFDKIAVKGADSGHKAINLAFHLGCSRIALIGYDMRFDSNRQAHWHPDHPIVTQERYYRDLFSPNYPGLMKALNARGIELVRITPSALDFIPEWSLEQVLETPAPHRKDI
jgi:hypothetical protein